MEGDARGALGAGGLGVRGDVERQGGGEGQPEVGAPAAAIDQHRHPDGQAADPLDRGEGLAQGALGGQHVVDDEHPLAGAPGSEVSRPP